MKMDECVHMDTTGVIYQVEIKGFVRKSVTEAFTQEMSVNANQLVQRNVCIPQDLL